MYFTNAHYVNCVFDRVVNDKTWGLEEITMDEAVFDFETANPPESEDPTCDHAKVISEEELVGKSAHISYNHNLLHLAQHLNLPITKCKHFDQQSQHACPSVPPFDVILKPRGTGVALQWVSFS